MATHRPRDGRRRRPSKDEDLTMSARPVSRGIAIGRAVSLYGRKRPFYRILIMAERVDQEIERFRSAVSRAKLQLRKLAQTRKTAPKKTFASEIFETHRMFLEDENFLSKIENSIADEKVNAEWAIKLVTDEYVSRFKQLDDAHLREKHIDIQDVAERLIGALSGGDPLNGHLPAGSVIVAKELNPSALMELAKSKPRGLVTEHGGWTSHTYILAREMNLPAVTGVKHVLRRVKTGDELIVDGNRGAVIANPPRSVLKEYLSVEKNRRSVVLPDKRRPQSELITLDGRRITMRANVDTADAYKRARRLGAKGIGLYRSEYLFNQLKDFPSEAVQIQAYSELAGLAGKNGVNIRTFDLNAEQVTGDAVDRETNPALGLRGIRLSFAYQKHFSAQIRAILVAAANGEIRIMLPMVSEVSEIRATRTVLAREKRKLAKRGVVTGNPKLGVMIEVPSAVLTVDQIAREVDFLCLGTNDLVQYVLAADRDNEAVADTFHTLHPAIIRAVKLTIDAGARAGIPVTVCGEMVGSPYYIPVLLGLGAVELSMNVNSISRVRRTIEGVAFEEAVEVVHSIRDCATSLEIEDRVRSRIRSSWAHLIDLESLSSPEGRAGDFG